MASNQAKDGGKVGLPGTGRQAGNTWWEVREDGSHFRISKGRWKTLRKREGVQVKEHRSGVWPQNISPLPGQFVPENGPKLPSGLPGPSKSQPESSDTPKIHISMDWEQPDSRPKTPEHAAPEEVGKRRGEELISPKLKAKDTKCTPPTMRFFSPPGSSDAMPNIGSVLDGLVPRSSPHTVPISESLPAGNGDVSPEQPATDVKSGVASSSRVVPDADDFVPGFEDDYLPPNMDIDELALPSPKPTNVTEKDSEKAVEKAPSRDVVMGLSSLDAAMAGAAGSFF